MCIFHNHNGIPQWKAPTREPLNSSLERRSNQISMREK
uniref:Uncharacterized protein n=1 Tax=Utricularia reniformis TaxID=192314 RepID=A0A1Y0B0G2_9LAMI|nr:hypothetical protein AEK19_MT0628 [Utricularia reniformis]ART30883.1 hypothetical protein AEK19_MT0628 [Utricularia reniformis]